MRLGFGLALATGVWGLVADAIADICRAHGLGPILKWVDDFLFLSVPLAALDSVNSSRTSLAASVGDRQARGGVAFFLGDDNVEHVEDYRFPLKNHVANAPDELVSSLQAISAVTAPLGVPWKTAKDADFCSTPTYIGFVWLIATRRVGLPESKRLKYLQAVATWLDTAKHTLEAANKLFGRLQHASFIITVGRKRLGSLRLFISSMSTAAPYAQHYASKQVAKDLLWWQAVLQQPDLQRSFAEDENFANIYVACDTSTSFGVGVFVGGAELSLPLRKPFASRSTDIAWLEAIAMEVAIEVVVDQGFNDCRLRVATDNTSVFFSEQSGHSRNPRVMAALARIRDLEARYNIEIHPYLVPSAQTWPTKLPEVFGPHLRNFVVLPSIPQYGNALNDTAWSAIRSALLHFQPAQAATDGGTSLASGEIIDPEIVSRLAAHLHPAASLPQPTLHRPRLPLAPSGLAAVPAVDRLLQWVPPGSTLGIQTSVSVSSLPPGRNQLEAPMARGCCDGCCGVTLKPAGEVLASLLGFTTWWTLWTLWQASLQAARYGTGFPASEPGTSFMEAHSTQHTRYSALHYGGPTD